MTLRHKTRFTKQPNKSKASIDPNKIKVRDYVTMGEILAGGSVHKSKKAYDRRVTKKLNDDERD